MMAVSVPLLSSMAERQKESEGVTEGQAIVLLTIQPLPPLTGLNTIAGRGHFPTLLQQCFPLNYSLKYKSYFLPICHLLDI